MVVSVESSSWLPTLEAAGAVFESGRGSAAPLHFGDWQAEWAAVRQRAGVFDARCRRLWALTGADRVSFLQGMVTADVLRVQPGRGTYAAAVTVQGRVVTDLRIYALENEFWLDVPATHADRLREHLEHYIVADDVEFRDLESRPLLVLEGRQADSVLARLSLEGTSSVPLYSHFEWAIGDEHLRVAVVTHTGERGYLFVGAADAFASLWQRLLDAGAQPVGRLALDVLRIEAGIPLVGEDMDESTLIAEAGIEAAIAYGKGCYLGQEVVERIAARGQVQRKRVGFVCRGPQLPERGAKVWLDEREVGTVTSAAWSPALERGIGFTYVRREAWAPGTLAVARSPQTEVEIEVVNLPFLQVPVAI